jgi:alpha/beta superfamily hydrolase
LNSLQSVFPCGNISLEGELNLPRGKSPFPVVVVCHPHPLHGGDMHNNVVVAICQALSRHSVVTFRFNFRGVGNSGGTYGEGIAEQEDVKAALAFVLSRPDIDPKKIGLVGYSFGASVSLPVALQDERVSLLALVSPALSDSGWEQLKGYNKSRFIIIGDTDFVIPLERFQQYIKGIVEPGQYRIVPGADHFWRGHEEELAQEVARFFVGDFNSI